METRFLDVPGIRVELPAPIRQKIELQGIVIIRVYPSDDELDDYPQEKLNRNVYAYKVTGELLWEIQEAPHGAERDKPYMNIWLDGDKLIAGNWIGTEYFVDLSSGEVKQTKFGVRPW